MICSDTIVQDSFCLSVHGGCGNIDLLINTTLSRIKYFYGTANLNVSGFSNVTYILANSYGPINSFKLTNNFLYMRTNGTNNTYVNVNKVLEAQIYNIGNVYYTGNPYTISSDETSTGSLIFFE